MTTTYSLRARTDGQVEVLENGASVLGVFPEEENARRFYRYMAGRFLCLTPAPAVEIEPAPAVALPAGDPVAPATGRNLARLRPITPKGPAAPVMHRPADLVARQRAQAVYARQGASACRLCGKDFLPSLSEPETCARCTRTMER